MKEINKDKVIERIWIFIAYQDSIPIISKLFNDFDEMKIYSGKHSHENNKQGYKSTYLNLMDKTLIQTIKKETKDRVKKEMLDCLPEEKVESWTEKACPIVDKEAIAFNDCRQQFLNNLKDKNL